MDPQPEFADIFKLPPAERLQLVEDLWDSLIPREAELAVPESVLIELRARKKRFDADPSSGMSWDQVIRGMDEG